MRKMMMFVLLMMAVVSTQAQTERVGKWAVTPYVGLNSTNVMNMDLAVGLSDNDVISSKAKYGLLIGTDVVYRLSSKFALSVGMNYSDEGYRFPSHHDYSGTTQSWKFINTPLLLRFIPEEKVSINVGLTPGYLMDYEKEFNGNLKRFNLSLPVGASFNVYGPIVFDLEIFFGLLNLNDNSFLNDKYRVNGGRLKLGYRFNL